MVAIASLIILRCLLGKAHNFLLVSQTMKKVVNQLANYKQQPLMSSTVLSNVLSITILALTIYHHFTVQEKMAESKRIK